MKEKLTIVIPSCNMEKAKKTQEGFLPFRAEIFDGTGYPSLAKLYNDCIIKYLPSSDYIIIANDKVRGDSTHIEGIMSLLESGYGLVGLYRFGFFGFSHWLVREVGLWDENFLQGGYEDVDYKNRLIEADIGIYESTSCPYEESGSRWKGNDNKAYYESKWHEIIGRPYCSSCKMNGASTGYDAMSCHRSNVIVRLKDEPKEMDIRIITEMDCIFHNYSRTFMGMDKTWKESILPANNAHLLGIEVVNGIY